MQHATEHQRKRNVGRPRFGAQRRVRVSFTLTPHQVHWLKQRARISKKSRSEILSELIERQPDALAPSQSFVFALPVPYQAIEAFSKKHRIARLSLFGSVVDPQRFAPQSDVDVLVEFEQDALPGLLAMVAMSQELQPLFGNRQIDLVTLQDLSPDMRPRVLRESRIIYART